MERPKMKKARDTFVLQGIWDIEGRMKMAEVRLKR